MGTGDTKITLTLLGSFELRVGGRACPELPRKAQALLALLALQNGRPLAREAAVDFLWSDSDTDRPYLSLRQTLGLIREQTGTGLVRLADGLLILRGDGHIIDTQRFESLAGSAGRHELACCAALYRGELLEDVATVARRFDQWLAVERIRFAAIAAEVMRQSALAHADAGEFDAAVTAARRLVALDELDEDSHRVLISVLGCCGRRAEALRHRGLCEQLLSAEPRIAADAEPVAVSPMPEPERVFAMLSPRRGRWWPRGGLAIACLVAAMIRSGTIEPQVPPIPSFAVVPVADTGGEAPIPTGLALPIRHFTGSERPVR